MKKSRSRKVLKIILLLAFCAGFTWILLSPQPVHRFPQSVQVKVIPPIIPDTESGKSTRGDEKSVTEDISQPALLPPDKLPQPGLGKGGYRIAIIIDDVGLDLKGSQRAIHLPAFITLSFLPYASRLRDQSLDARHAGHELMLHMPMEPLGHADPGPGALILGLPQDEIKQRLDNALASFVGFDGMNNHMGSKFTADESGMKLVVSELQQRHLFYVDSRTSPQTVGESIARKQGLPTIARDVFLDDDESLTSIQHQLQQTEHVAQRKGYAVAIGHPHVTTLEALEKWIPDAQKRGFILVPVHSLISPSSSETP